MDKTLQLRLNRFIRIRPTPRQAAFMMLPHREALFGGAVGGGKSAALLMAALQYVDVPGYDALIVKKNYPSLAQPNGLIFQAKHLLAPSGATWNVNDMAFSFPSGATLTFRHHETASAESNFQGGEYHFIGVDEATDFTKEQVLFLSSRLRKGPGDPIPLRLRVTAYPNGPGKEWVYRYFILEGPSNGRPFIESHLEDNPYIDTDSYDEFLRGLGHIRYEQYRRGNWTIREEGTLFKPVWFDERYLERSELPDHLQLCRAWDLAATEGDGDYTAGVLLGMSADGLAYVIDVRRARHRPLGVERLIVRTAEEDAQWARSRGYQAPVIVMEQEPASSGKSLVDYFRRKVLCRYEFRAVSPSGSKESRAGIVSARAEQGDLYICRSDGVEAFLDELAAFPFGDHDDQVDALSTAFLQLASREDSRVAHPSGSTQENPWACGSSYAHNWYGY